LCTWQAIALLKNEKKTFKPRRRFASNYGWNSGVRAKIGTLLGERLCWLRWALAAPSTSASTAAAKHLAMAFTLSLRSSASIFLATNLQAIQRLEKNQPSDCLAHL